MYEFKIATEIPPDHRLVIDVPREIPAGRVILTFTPANKIDDETEYLCSSPVNQRHLENAIANVEQGKNLVSFEKLEQAIQNAEELAATR
jgi:hypothetical protein